MKKYIVIEDFPGFKRDKVYEFHSSSIESDQGNYRIEYFEEEIYSLIEDGWLREAVNVCTQCGREVNDD